MSKDSKHLLAYELFGTDSEEENVNAGSSTKKGATSSSTTNSSLPSTSSSSASNRVNANSSTKKGATSSSTTNSSLPSTSLPSASNHVNAGSSTKKGATSSSTTNSSLPSTSSSSASNRVNANSSTKKGATSSSTTNSSLPSTSSSSASIDVNAGSSSKKGATSSTSAPNRIDKKRNYNAMKMSAEDLFGNDSDDDVSPQNGAGRRIPSLISHINRKLARGVESQTFENKPGNYFVELRVYNCSEIEQVHSMHMWRNAVITIKNRTDDDTKAWRFLSSFITETRNEFKGRPTTFIHY